MAERADQKAIFQLRFLSICRAVVLLLSRGEFNVRPTLLLLSIYASAILAIPLVLSSILSLSTAYFGPQIQFPELQTLLYSIYLQVENMYTFVEITLLTGFGFTGLLSGLSLARKTRNLQPIIDMGARRNHLNDSTAFLLLLITLGSIAIAVSLSEIVVSGVFFVTSFYSGGGYLSPTLTSTYIFYLVLALIICYFSLFVGLHLRSIANRINPRYIERFRARKRILKLFKLFPRRIIFAYFFGLTVLLISSSIVLMVGLSQTVSVGYTTTGQMNQVIAAGSSPSNRNSSQTVLFPSSKLVTEQSSRTIYTSRVPVTVADAINAISNSSIASSGYSFPITISLVNTERNMPLVVLGVPPSIYQRISSKAISNESNLLLGYIAAKELGAFVGSIVPLSSPFNRILLNETVSEILTTGTEQDYEAIVPIALGQELAGLDPGIANAIVLNRGDLGSEVSLLHHIQLTYLGPPGTVYIVDSTGYVHDSFSANSSERFNLDLPFGLYTVVLSQGSLRTSIGQFTSAANQTRNVNATFQPASDKLLSLTVYENGSGISQPRLTPFDSDQLVMAESFNQSTQSWVYFLHPGEYNLTTDSKTSSFYLFGNTTFGSELNFDSILEIGIVNSPPDGSFFLTVTDENTSQIVFDSSLQAPGTSLPVESGHNYFVILAYPSSDLLLDSSLRANSAPGTSNSLTFTLPNIPNNLQSTPISDYAQLGIGYPTKNGAFDYLLGGAILSTASLFGIVLALLSVTVVFLTREFFASIRNEVGALGIMSPSPGAVLRNIKRPILGFSLLTALLSVVLSYFIFIGFSFESTLSFAGYGIDFFPIVYVVLVLITFAILGYARFVRHFNAEIVSKNYYSNY